LKRGAVKVKQQDDCLHLYVDITAALEQHTDTVSMLFTHGHVKTRASSLVDHVHAWRAFLHQQLHHCRLVTAEEHAPFPR